MHPGKGADVQNWGTGRRDTKELVRKAVWGAGGIAREKDKREELAAKPRP